MNGVQKHGQAENGKVAVVDLDERNEVPVHAVRIAVGTDVSGTEGFCGESVGLHQGPGRVKGLRLSPLYGFSQKVGAEAFVGRALFPEEGAG